MAESGFYAALHAPSADVGVSGLDEFLFGFVVFLEVYADDEVFVGVVEVRFAVGITEFEPEEGWFS